jgi:hypothetical protein
MVVALRERGREVKVGDGVVLGWHMAQEEVAQKGVFKAVQQRWAMIRDLGWIRKRVGWIIKFVWRLEALEG